MYLRTQSFEMHEENRCDIKLIFKLFQSLPNPGTEPLQSPTEWWTSPMICTSVVAFSFAFREEFKAIAAIDGYSAGINVPQSAIISERDYALCPNLKCSQTFLQQSWDVLEMWENWHLSEFKIIHLISDILDRVRSHTPGTARKPWQSFWAALSSCLGWAQKSSLAPKDPVAPTPHRCQSHCHLDWGARHAI